MGEIRTIPVSQVTESIKEMCIQANYFLSEDMEACFQSAVERETSELGCRVLRQLQENLKIAGEDQIPICQDTGMAVVFLEVGQDVHFVDGSERGHPSGLSGGIPEKIRGEGSADPGEYQG